MQEAPGSTRRILPFVGVVLLAVVASSASGPRVIDLVADSDNKFKIPRQKEAVITLRASEVVVLRITSRRGTEWEKDDAVHSLTITALKDRGWDLRLKEGTKLFPVVAPAQPGEYVVECTIKCGKGHDDMRMKLIVVP
ncbi:MAG: hypothetical protein HY235_09560 [Acidobacteria bacterium]|nr:hypothetical protein [Acidobacteriota bacterium]